MKLYLFLLALFPFFSSFAQSSNLNAFGDTPWGESFKSVRDKYESLARNPKSKENIQIVNEIRNKLLVVKRNNVVYIYRFYKEPREVSEVKAASGEDKKQDHKAASGLFSVGVVFSPVDSLKARDTLLQKYGNPSREYLVENSFGIIKQEEVVFVKNEKKAEGEEEPEEVEMEPKEDAGKIPAAYIWNLSSDSDGKRDGGYIIQWNEPYQKKLYTKRMDYFSAELSSIINSDYKEYFSARETKIIFDLMTTPPSLQVERDAETPRKEIPENQ
jgi:hypothetical protein